MADKDEFEQYAAPAADEFEQYAAPAQGRELQAKPKVDPGTGLDTAADAAVGVGSGAAMGFDDELKGAFDSVQEYMMNLGAGQGTEAAKAKGGQAYVQGRDTYRQRQHLAEERSPAANLTGKIGGTIATSLIPGGAAAKGAGLLARGAAATGRLALEGGAMGLGSSEADLTKGDFAGAAEDTAKGAAVGVAAGGLGRLAVKGAGAVGRQVGEYAPKLARQAKRWKIAATGQRVSDVENAPGGLDEATAALKARGIGGALASKAKIAEQAQAANAAIESERGALAGEIGKLKPRIRGRLAAEEVRKQIRKLSARPGEGKLPPAAPRPVPGGPVPVSGTAPTHISGEIMPAAPSAGKATMPGGRLKPRGVRRAANGEPNQADIQAVAAKLEGGGTESSVNQAQRDFLENEARVLEDKGDMTFEEANRLRGVYGAAGDFGADTAGRGQAAGAAQVHKAINDILEVDVGGAELAANQVPVMGRQFRQLGQQQMHVIGAQKGANRAMDQGANQQLADAADVGMAAFGGWSSIPAIVARKLMKGRAHSLAGATGEALAPGLAKIGRAGQATSAMAPAVGSTLGRMSAGQAAADQSAERVKSAFLEGGPEAAAKAHYEESMKNPDYRQGSSGY